MSELAELREELAAEPEVQTPTMMRERIMSLGAGGRSTMVGGEG